MLAIQVAKEGGPEVLTPVDLPVPTPKPNEAIVQVKAAGVNFVDVYYREGRYPTPLPFISGQEAAGVVTQIGSEVKSLALGDRVAYSSVLGSYAEYAAVPADRLLKIPEGIEFNQAAAAMLQGMTAHYLSHSTYKLQAGETALVHAAAGGVGALLVQMCKRIGAKVIATAGSEEKAQLAREAGADERIIYTQGGFEAETRRLTNGNGVHVVYDGVGKATFDQDLNVLRLRGYLALFGGASGAVPLFDLIKLSQKGSLCCALEGILDLPRIQSAFTGTNFALYVGLVKFAIRNSQSEIHTRYDLVAGLRPVGPPASFDNRSGPTNHRIAGSTRPLQDSGPPRGAACAGYLAGNRCSRFRHAG